MKIKFKSILMALLAVATLFTACSKDDKVIAPSVGLSRESFGIDSDNEADVKMVTSHGKITGEVAFVLKTKLKEGVDYKIDKKVFSFDNSSNATVKVKFLKNINDSDTFEIDLQPITFATLGLAKAKVGIFVEDVILYTFDKADYIMTASVTTTLQLSKIVGSFTAEKPIALEVEVDPSSTAVEGVHFKFTNGKVLTVAAGQNRATLKIELIKQVAGKDKIVLRLKNAPMAFKAGNYDKANIAVFGTYFDKVKGTWQFSNFYNLNWFETDWGMETKLFPTNNSASDKITFDEDKMIVSMTGDLRKYFRNSTIKTKNEVMEVFQEDGWMARGNILLIDALANVTFSDTKIKERQAEMGIRTVTVAGVEYLEITVRDFEPVGFMDDMWSWMKDGPDMPRMKSAPLRLRFVKVKEPKE